MTPFNKTLTIATIAAVLSGCGGGGDINITPTTVDNSVDNSTTNSGGGDTTTNICAAYVKNGQTFQGSLAPNGIDCAYGIGFVGSGNNLEEDLVLSPLPNGGVHYFQDNLFVGNSYSSQTALDAAGITTGGDGPTLTVEAGTTVTFAAEKFLVVNRGSQILAAGTASAPITFTTIRDVENQRGNDPDFSFDEIGSWGGMVINGFGISNKCAYTGSLTAGTLAYANPAEGCSVDAEGAEGLDESQYGGLNNADSSGRLEYVLVKHTGQEVANGDELNGISFGAVGSGTIVRNLQTYATLDDGIEMFGGAVNITNYIGMYSGDDTIDIDEGYSGTISNALVIQGEQTGNQCIESDGIGSYSSQSQARIDEIIAAGLNSRPTINNLTCILSNNDESTNSKGPGTGWRFREGIWPTINDSLVIASFSADANDTVDNECLRIDSAETNAAFAAGNASINGTIFACEERVKGSAVGGLAIDDFVNANNGQFATITGVTNPTAAADTALALLQGTPPIYSIDLATMVVDDAAPTVTAVDGSFIGALSESATDWTAGWSYGLRAGARAVDANGADIPLWFE